jgi:hypothetical protein
MPTMIATLKVSVGLSLVGVVVGEFQSVNLRLGFSDTVWRSDLSDERRDDVNCHPRDCFLFVISCHRVAR